MKRYLKCQQFSNHVDKIILDTTNFWEASVTCPAWFTSSMDCSHYSGDVDYQAVLSTFPADG